MAGYGMKTKGGNKTAEKLHRQMKQEARKAKRGQSSKKRARVTATNKKRIDKAVKKGDVTTKTTTRRVIDKPATTKVIKGYSKTTSTPKYVAGDVHTDDSRYKGSRKEGSKGSPEFEKAKAQARADKKKTFKWKGLDYGAGRTFNKTKTITTPDKKITTPATYKDKTTTVTTPKYEKKIATYKKPKKGGSSGVATTVNTKNVRTTASGLNKRQKKRAERQISRN
jgi:hypothetical protein